MSGMGMTLREVKVRQVVVPLKLPVVSKVGVYTEWPLILIDAYMKEGVVGRSYLAPYLAKAMRYIVPAIADLAEPLLGKRVAPLDSFLAGRAGLGLVGKEGIALIAVSGLDMALWDALAQAAGMPLAVYLGGSLGPVPAYNSNGLWLEEPGVLARQAKALVAEGGFTALKLRLGRARLADDLAALGAVREAVGAEVRLMVDFNQGLTLAQALERCHNLDDAGFDWFEEPIPYDDWNGYAQLRRELRTPLQFGENLYGPRSLYAALQAEVGDLVMPDLMRIGGVSGWLRAAGIAGAAGIPMSSHLYPEMSAHLLRVTESAHWLEWQDWADPILAEPFPVRDGHIHIPDRPGSGVQWNEDAVKRYQVGA